MNINLTLFGQMVTFAIFVWFCMKFIWPILLTALEERQKKIEDGLNYAEKASRDLANAEQEIDAKLDEAKVEASSIIDQANKNGKKSSREPELHKKAAFSHIFDTCPGRQV